MSKQGKKLSRKEQRRQQLARENRMRRLRIWLPVAVVVALIGAVIIIRVTEPEVEGAIFVDSAIPNQHDDDITYGFGGLPPTGGVHRSVWQNCGIYTEPVGAEFAIHSMEHGAVWITYDPELPGAEVAALQDLVRGESYTLLSPYPDQESPVVLTAWDVQLQLSSSSDDRIAEFVDKYRRTRGPEDASCSGGVGQPVG